MNFFNIFLILIILFGISAILYIFYFNKMQYLKTKIEHAEGIIDETLRLRYDTLVDVDNLVKSTLKDDKEYFKEYIQLKNKKVSNFEMDRKLKEAFHILEKLKEDFPDLQKNKDIKELTNTIKETNEKITATTSYYNKNTNLLNGYIRKFPSTIIAKFHGFKISAFFDGKDMTDEDINDFKL